MSSSDLHPASLSADELLRECDVHRHRRSGPGGQHRNKVETAIAVRHRPSGIAAEAGERRSQAENQRVALARLRVNLALQVRCRTIPASDPSLLWQSRCRNGRIVVSIRHADFPVLLAEALDVLTDFDMDVQAAVGFLGCTPSQLVRFLKVQPRGLALVNRRRQEIGLHQLK